MILARTMGSLLLAGLALGATTACVGENPDWDERTTSVREEMTTSASSGDDGQASSGGDDSNAAEACVHMGLAACESDAMIACVDVMTDISHCGACFSDCAAMGGEACRAGVCDCPGGPSNRICHGACVDTNNDMLACGDDCVDCTLEFGDEAECDKSKCKDND
jgi:hypothetical protein